MEVRWESKTQRRSLENEGPRTYGSAEKRLGKKDEMSAQGLSCVIPGTRIKLDFKA